MANQDVGFTLEELKSQVIFWQSRVKKLARAYHERGENAAEYKEATSQLDVWIVRLLTNHFEMYVGSLKLVLKETQPWVESTDALLRIKQGAINTQIPVGNLRTLAPDLTEKVKNQMTNIDFNDPRWTMLLIDHTTYWGTSRKIYVDLETKELGKWWVTGVRTSGMMMPSRIAVHQAVYQPYTTEWWFVLGEVDMHAWWAVQSDANDYSWAYGPGVEEMLNAETTAHNITSRRLAARILHDHLLETSGRQLEWALARVPADKRDVFQNMLVGRRSYTPRKALHALLVDSQEPRHRGIVPPETALKVNGGLNFVPAVQERLGEGPRWTTKN